VTSSRGDGLREVVASTPESVPHSQAGRGFSLRTGLFFWKLNDLLGSGRLKRYLLDALQRFDGMPLEDVRDITAEIAIIGTTGLDYASSEAKYSVRSLSSDKKYSGLKLMCYMYVGFKILQPDVDSTIDLDEPYQAALALFRSQNPREEE
jgi:hypothetical protein